MFPYLPAGLKPEDLEGLWDDHLLLPVIWRRNSLEALQPLEGILSPLSLVGDHTPHSSPEDLSGGTEMEGAAKGLHVATETQELEVLELVTVEVSGHADAFGAHNHHFVAVQEKLGHDGGQTADQVTASIDHHWLKN